MKRVVSVSLGSSARNHKADLKLLGEDFHIERIGTDGDIKKMIALIKELDGKVDAFGLGGIDLYIQAINKRYTLRDAQKIVRVARLTPILDGSGLKNTLERRVINILQVKEELFSGQKKALMICAMDRLGLAQALEESGCQMIYGDLLFVLGLPIPLYSLMALARVAQVLVPLVRLLPISMIYPTGEKQEQNKPRFPHYFEEADIIAGDYHFIRRFIPPKLEGKIMITNTVTANDLVFLRERGVKVPITTTPEMQGRSFGTNVMEALLVAFSGKKRELHPQEYEALLEELNIKPRLTYL